MSNREGNLEAPIRHPLGQDEEGFYDEQQCFAELERVFDICHGCRRCFSLCGSFPTLFDLVDESETMEVDGVDKADYWQVVDHCYQCDLCYQTKCPYVPPHEFNVDFPHLMLRAKAIRFRKGESKFRDRLITSTDALGAVAARPVVAGLANAANGSKLFRNALDGALGIHPQAPLPPYQAKRLSARLRGHVPAQTAMPEVQAGEVSTGDLAGQVVREDPVLHDTGSDAFVEAGAEVAAERPSSVGQATQQRLPRGRVALFATCYGEYNAPQLGEDIVAVFEHNGMAVTLVADSRCCGMPKFDLGDLDSVTRLKEHNIPVLARYVQEGWDIVTPIPSCTLMFKTELPLMFPHDKQVQAVARACYDPFEYLMARHRAGCIDTRFSGRLGKVAWHVACHQRVQNMGAKTREFLELIPETEVVPIERCSGHDGTYTIKSETHDMARKILAPVVKRVQQAEADHYASDCIMAGHHIEFGMADGSHATHPMTLVRKAYGI